MKRFNLLLAFGLTILLSGKSNAQVTWTQRSDRAPIYFFKDIFSIGPLTIAIEDNGKHIVSADGITWKEVRIQGGREIKSIIWAGTQFVAVGSDSLGIHKAAFTSPDGISWTQRKTSIRGAFNCVAWTGTQLVAGDAEGRIYTSKDGIVWKHVTALDAPGSITALTWTGTQLVAAGFDYTFTSTDGKNWTQSEKGENIRFKSIIKTDTQFVGLIAEGSITSHSPRIVLTSSNGLNWTERKIDPSSGQVSVTWNGHHLVALATNGMVYTSPDALSWTQLNSGAVEARGMEYLTWNGKQLIAMSKGGAIFTSPDGVTWTNRRSIEPSPYLYSVAASKSQSVAVGYDGAVLSSPDGIAWTARNTGTHKTLNSITWTGTQFYAVGDTGSILSSPDGVVWTIKNSGILSSLKCVFWTGDKFIVAGDGGTILISHDGNVWTKVNSGTAAKINSIIGNGTQLVAVGDFGAILTSPDGLTWTSRNSGLNNKKSDFFLSVMWTGSQFVAVGSSSAQCRTSPDGVTWTSKKMQSGQIGFGGTFASIVWTGSQFVAITNSGYQTFVHTSLDGSNWQDPILVEGALSTINAITWTGTQYIIVGFDKTIFTSPQIASTAIINPESIHNSLSIRVSPASLAVTVPSDMLNEKIKVSIYSITGKRVLDRIGEKSLGQLSVPIQKMPMGRYLLEVSGSNRKLSKPFCLIQ